jgi:hypothetical protein
VFTARYGLKLEIELGLNSVCYSPAVYNLLVLPQKAIQLALEEAPLKATHKRPSMWLACGLVCLQFRSSAVCSFNVCDI